MHKALGSMLDTTATTKASVILIAFKEQTWMPDDCLQKPFMTWITDSHFIVIWQTHLTFIPIFSRSHRCLKSTNLKFLCISIHNVGIQRNGQNWEDLPHLGKSSLTGIRMALSLSADTCTPEPYLHSLPFLHFSSHFYFDILHLVVHWHWKKLQCKKSIPYRTKPKFCCCFNLQ